MKRAFRVTLVVVFLSLIIGILMGEEVEMARKQAKILFLHHSTGGCVWEGGVAEWFEKYNKEHSAAYNITETAFPKDKPYGWANYPYDYWNIWVQNAGPRAYKEEPTLEILTKECNIIIFKHCFPVASVKEDRGKPDVASDRKSIENYKLQYEALKAKLRQFPDTKFIVWTGAMLCKADTSEDNAKRAKEFFKWVKTAWDEKGDNIFLWDFEQLETDGGLYLKDEYAAAPDDSHPNVAFSKRVAPLFAARIVDVIEGRGDTGSLTGK